MNKVRACGNPLFSIHVVVHVDVSLTALCISLIINLISWLFSITNILVVLDIENFNVLFHSNIILLNSVVA